MKTDGNPFNGSWDAGEKVSRSSYKVLLFTDHSHSNLYWKWRTITAGHCIEFHENSFVGSRDTRGNVQISWYKLAPFIDRFQQNLEGAYGMYSDARLWRMMEIPLTGHEIFTKCYFDLNAKCSELTTDLHETCHIWIIAINSSRW